MKFHCNRCKTRYSIADDRVRGKILKIRCKNCSAVITVREEMGARRKPSPAAASTVPEVRRPPAASPKSVEATPDASASPLRGAFQEVFERPVDEGEQSEGFEAPAPDHLEQEWYVAIEGEQSGPFSLQEAKAWVAGQSRETELFCWNEDFDDWLPVEKVSHFRGLRARSGSPSTPAPETSPAANSRLAKLAAEADSGIFQGGDILDQETPKPLFAPTFAALEAQQKAAEEAEQAAEHQPVDPDLGQTLVDQPSFRDLLPPATPDPALPASLGPAANAPPVPAAPAPQPPPPGNAAAPPILRSTPPEAANSEAAAASANASDADFDLDIGEASRVVKVPLITDRPGQAPATSGDGTLPGVARIRKGSVLGVGTGPESSIPPLAPLSEEALAEANPGVLAPSASKRRSNLVVLIVVGVAVVAVVLGVMIALMQEGDEDGPLARSKLAGDELAWREGGDRIRVVTREVEKKDSSGGTRRPKRRPGENGESSSSDDVSDTDGAEQPGETLQPLTPSDVVRALRENSLGNKRCYERALKKDPFLKVSKIKVTLSVAPSGVVTALKMDSHADTFLGQCLAARIRKWPFRKSPNGITTELTLSFEQM